MAYAAVTVASANSTKIVAANPNRNSLVIENNSSVTVYIGSDSSVTSANGIPLLAGGTFQEDSGGHKVYCGDIYGRAASATADIRYWERSQL